MTSDGLIHMSFFKEFSYLKINLNIILPSLLTMENEFEDYLMDCLLF